MEKINESPLVSCKLSTPELQQRKKTVIAELKSHLLQRVDLEDGVQYHFHGSDQMIDLISDFVKSERLCCDFLNFNMHVSADRKLLLSLTGPAGSRDFITHEIGF